MSQDGPKRPVTAEDLVQLRDLGPVAISPDGAAIAFEIRRADPDRNAYCLGMFVMSLQGAHEIKQVDSGREPILLRFNNFGLSEYPAGTLMASTPKWSPDGRWIAYRKRVGGVIQLWRADATSGLARAIIAHTVDIDDFTWSADSTSLIFLSRPSLAEFKRSVTIEGARGFLYDDRFAPGVADEPMPRTVAVISQTMDLATGVIRRASNAESALLQPASRALLRSPELRAVSKSGAVASTLSPATPNGPSAIQAVIAGQTYRCDAEPCRAGLKAIWWNTRETEIRFLRKEGEGRTQTALYRWTLGSPRPRRLLASEDVIEECAPLNDDFVCAHEASTSPRRLVSISASTGEITTLFDPNPEFQRIALQPAERLHWRNAIGLDAYGDLVLPANHRPGQRHPLIIVSYTSRGFLRGGTGDEYPIQLFAANGYAVLSFNRPIDVGDISPTGDVDRDAAAGLGGWADRRSVHSALQAGIDVVERKGVVDPTRIGITGLSEGAFMAQWAILHSDRFAAASVSSIVSQSSFLGIGGPARAATFRRWGLLGFADPRASAFWQEASISEAPERVTAPLLVQASSDEYLDALDGYQSLKELGRPVELYVFPGDHHIKWQPSHRLAVYRRNLQWFDFWLNRREDPSPLDPDQYRRWREMRIKDVGSSGSKGVENPGS